MKRFFKAAPVILALAMLLLLAGCVREVGIDNEPERPITTAESTDDAASAQPGMQEPSETGGESKSLVVYFSWSGNTQQMARWVAEESGSDIYRVTPAQAYSSDYSQCADRAKEELDNGIRPELDNLLEAEVLARYDTIYVGFPIWWYDLPMPMTAFLERYDLSGKTVIPFFSHNGSSSGAGSLDTLAELCGGANVRTGDALSISGDSMESSESQVRDWVKQLQP